MNLALEEQSEEDGKFKASLPSLYSKTLSQNRIKYNGKDVCLRVFYNLLIILIGSLNILKCLVVPITM